MKKHALVIGSSAVVLGAIAFAISNQGVSKPKPDPEPAFDWVTVVNNNDRMPDAPNERTFNSYNQPSVNSRGLVVLRARSKGGDGGGGGGHGPTHGIYTRDMSRAGNPIVRILDRSTQVPYPNNLATTFVETPSFPRIDMESDTIATRGNHQPVWNYVIGTDPDTDEDIETRAGTTGIYSNPFGDLMTGASKLGAVPEFTFFEVPGESPGTLFEVFPGAPSITAGDTLVFKGNYTVGASSYTGVYYRTLEDAPAGGESPSVLIANTSTLIPGTTTVFGSTAPPSAAKGQVVFAGFDDEDDPELGGVYIAPLEPMPELTPLVSIGGPVPDEPAGAIFNGLGEGGAFDGRFVGFWGAWGSDTDTRRVRLYCQTEGNRDRIAFCNKSLVCEDAELGAPPLGDPDSVCDDDSDPFYGERCYQERDVPVNQGFFVHDSKTRKTWTVAKTGEQFNEFLFWNYSGKVPCTGGGHSEEGGEDDGEPARWRSSAFVAVAGRGATFKAAFKARAGDFAGGVYVDPVDGIYLGKWPATGQSSIATVLDTTMDGQSLDPEAPEGSLITELGIELEGLRGDLLVINAKMAAPVEDGEEEEEEDDMAGIYLTNVK